MKFDHSIKKFLRIFIVSVSLIPVWCIAKKSTIENEFINTEKLINKNKINSTKQISNKLKNYSLYPYLEFEILRNRLNSNPTTEIKDFYSKYNTEPVTKKLNYYWISHLYKNKRYQEILDYYRDNGSTRLQCMYLTAKQKIAPNSLTQDEINNIWLVGKSRPSECDELFQTWLNDDTKKILSKDLIWQRIYLAIEQNNASLAMYLGKYLSVGDHEDIKLWHRVHSNPALINNTKLFNKKNLFHHKIVIHGLQQTAIKNIDKSLRYFRQLNQIYKFKDKEKYNYYKFLVTKMYLKDHSLIESTIQTIPYKYYDEDTHTIAIKNALKTNNWDLVIKRINKLPLDLRKQDIWIYWQARAYDKIKNYNMAKGLYASIASKTNYYGLMACNNLKQFCPIEFTITQPFQKDKAKLLEHSGIKRAIELYKLARTNDARLEWNHVVKTLNEKQKFIAANIADELSWHDRSIITMALYDQGKEKNIEADSSSENDNSDAMLHLKYPLGYQELVLKFAKKYKIDPAWVFAISRQESAFIKDAKSHVGAIGLMQLMPATAKQVAKDYKIPYSNKWNLLKENTNISLGSAYLQQMLENHNGNPVLATAAYNAGPHRVKQWTKDIESIDTDVWIELVPFKETRNYLKHVMTNTAIYRSRLGKSPSQMNDIFPAKIDADK